VQRSLVRRGTAKDEPWKLVPPKTDKGRRVVVLPSFAVRAHRAAQAQERLLIGAEYGDQGFVFATEFGRPLGASNLYDRNFRRIMSKAGLGAWVGG
jgi:integrase